MKRKAGTKPPIKEGEKIMHDTYGTGTVTATGVTGGGRWHSIVDFDVRPPGLHPKILCEYLSVIPTQENEDEHSRASGTEA